MLVLRQTAAIFVDAYRELNARRLFWIALVISAVVVAAFALVGINERGITVAGWEFPAPFNTSLIGEDVFYKLMFNNLGVRVWLTWAATILALVSTAAVIPDFISGGAVELSLSKPIGRVRLFLTKYLTGLLFVALQVTVFTSAAFFVIGFRGGAWVPGVFLAIPLVVLFFSYLFCVCALIGLVTRSTIAALLLTCVFWLAVFLVHTAEASLLLFRTNAELRVQMVERDIRELPERIATLGEPADKKAATELERLKARLERREKQLPDEEKSQRQLNFWHSVMYATKFGMPKTSETMDLLRRQLVSSTDMQRFEERDADQTMPNFDPGDDLRVPQRVLARRVQEQMDARSPVWILGTSIGFEIIVLGVACLIFARRDF